MSTKQDFLILDAIDRHQPSSQRELARFSGMSLGKTNYVLKRLVDEGLIKISSLKESTKNTHYPYLLTPKGILAKSLLTMTFIQDRMQEFEKFRNRMLENLKALQDQGVNRLLLCGSDNMIKFLAHIAGRENLDLQIVGTASDPKDFERFAEDSYDRILIADHSDRFSQLLATKSIPASRVTYLN